MYNGTNITKNYSYYENGALKNVTNKSGNTIVSLYNCEYQLDGNLSKVTDGKGGQKTYTYSSTGRLANETYKKGAVTESTDYTYDSRGNRLSAVYTSSQNPEDNCKKMYLYDTNNRLLRERKDYTSRNADTEIYRYYYDNNGNQVKKVSNKITANASTENMSVGICLASENSGYDVEKRTYDVYNRLTEVKKNNSTVGTYTYLPNDLRLSKTVGNNTTYFMWSGDDILAELNGSYTVTAQYVYGTERIYNCINNNYYLYNNHGDTSEVTNANGIVVKSYSLDGFDAYGDEKNPDSNDTNPFRYCGEYYDAETGNIYLRARYYDPSIGGFITEDPARDGTNWYGYCAGNPVMRVDSSGLCYYDINGNWCHDNWEYTGGYERKEDPRKNKSDYSDAHAYADTNNFYGLTESQKIANAEYIYTYLSDKGWSSQAICGLLGNIEQESCLNPAAWQNNYKDLDNGYGLIQWTPALKLCNQVGLTTIESIDDAAKNPEELIRIQLDFIISSCQPGRGEWLPGMGVNSYGSPYEMSFEDFTVSENAPGELALVFHGHYERSKDNEERKNNRVNYANKWSDYFDKN